jgi:hypothetical protein
MDEFGKHVKNKQSRRKQCTESTMGSLEIRLESFREVGGRKRWQFGEPGWLSIEVTDKTCGDIGRADAIAIQLQGKVESPVVTETLGCQTSFSSPRSVNKNTARRIIKVYRRGM